MTAPAHDSDAVPDPTLEEVSDGVFAYVQLDGSWGLNNTGFLVGSEGVVVVDTCFTERRTRAFLDAVRSVTPRPLRTLVNTHHHGDHTHGNWLLSPGATIVGHERCRAGILATGTGASALFPGVEWGDIPPTPPFVTFESQLAVYVDDLRVELVAHTPAHTDSDVVAWLPERRVLFAGDLVFNGGTPFVVMGSVSGAVAAVEALQSLGAETVVPGHGPVCGPEAFDEQLAYLRFVQDVAARAVAAGVGPLEAARETDLGRFAEWHDPERIVGNLHRAMAEAQGLPPGGDLDILSAFAEMVAYNGGRPLRCLA